MTIDIKAEVACKSLDVCQKIKADSKLGSYISMDRIPGVFMDADNIGNIRLVVIGQDPTVKREASRKTIETVLNLDKQHGALYRYISLICAGLGLDLHQNVYATNYAKNFFTDPPTQVKEYKLLEEVGQYWLPLLHEELSYFPSCPIITLGEPLLKALSFDSKKAWVRRYWGYTPEWTTTTNAFSFVLENENRLGRSLFPFPHQPSLRKKFYSTKLQPYLLYMRNTVAQG